MEVILTNAPRILTDFGEYVRIGKIDHVFVASNAVHAIVSGTKVTLTNYLRPSAAQAALRYVLDVIDKYDANINLCIKREYVAGLKTFEGTYTLINPLDSDPNHVIRKYTWSRDGLILEQGPLVGAWDNKENLGW